MAICSFSVARSQFLSSTSAIRYLCEPCYDSNVRPDRVHAGNGHIEATGRSQRSLSQMQHSVGWNVANMYAPLSSRNRQSKRHPFISRFPNSTRIAKVDSRRNVEVRCETDGNKGVKRHQGAGSTSNFFESLKSGDLGEVTPVTILQWIGTAGFAVLLYKALMPIVENTLLHPKLWMYASWFFVFWPLPVSFAFTVWILRIALRLQQKKATNNEQVVLLGGALFWLIIVPCTLAQGYLDFLPFLLYALYFIFFLVQPIMRQDRYGSLVHRQPEEKWATPVSRMTQVKFLLAMVVGHWAAAWEAFGVDRKIPGSNILALSLLITAYYVHFGANYYLIKYSDRLVHPKSVVYRGPYRWVRHPMYSSYMVLAAGFCCALRSYGSLIFLLVASFAYFDCRARLEEEQLLENFGPTYEEYRSRVKTKFVPFLI